jgi:hypothetical protein
LIICGCDRSNVVQTSELPSTTEDKRQDYCEIEVETVNAYSAFGTTSLIGEYDVSNKVKRDNIILDFYAQGDLVKTTRSGGIVNETAMPIGKANFAIHIFDNSTLQLSPGYKIYIGKETDHVAGITNPIDISKDEFNCDKHLSCGTFSEFAARENTLPIFYIIGNTADGGSMHGGGVDGLLERNPTAFIVVGSLSVEK